jgi:hypothetical protein
MRVCYYYTVHVLLDDPKLYVIAMASMVTVPVVFLAYKSSLNYIGPP